MAEKLDSFTFTSGSRHDWDSWLNGEIWQLSHGTDFESKPGSFVATAKKQANKRNLTLKSQIDGNTVVIQATS